jgi:hypothetical protein
VDGTAGGKVTAQFLYPSFVSFVPFLYLGAGKVHLDTWVIAVNERP